MRVLKSCLKSTGPISRKINMTRASMPSLPTGEIATIHTISHDVGSTPITNRSRIIKEM